MAETSALLVKNPAFRRQLYAWLAAAFYAPDAQTSSELFVKQGAELCSVLEIDTAAFETLAARFSSASAEYMSDPAGSGSGSKWLLELQREYARLFLGPPHVLVRPYQSCCVSGEMMMGECTVVLRKLYSRWGQAMNSRDEPEAPDHIAVQLTFLSLLCEQRSRDKLLAEQLERELLLEHLGSWALIFADQVKKQSKHPFYSAASQLLLAAIPLVINIAAA